MQVKIQINLIWNSKTERSNIYIRVLISLFAAEYNYIFIIFTNEFYVLTGIGEVLILFSLSLLIVSKHLGRNSSGRHTLRMSYAFSSCFSRPLLHFMCQMAHGIENIVRIRIWIAFGIRIRFRIFHLHSMAISAFFASGLWPHKTEKMREGWGRGSLCGRCAYMQSGWIGVAPFGRFSGERLYGHNYNQILMAQWRQRQPPDMAK